MVKSITKETMVVNCGTRLYHKGRIRTLDINFSGESMDRRYNERAIQSGILKKLRMFASKCLYQKRDVFYFS